MFRISTLLYSWFVFSIWRTVWLPLHSRTSTLNDAVDCVWSTMFSALTVTLKTVG